jgi:hypothetical protein
VDLAHRCGRQWLAIERGEEVIDGCTELSAHNLLDPRPRDRLSLVLQSCQLVGYFGWYEVSPRREHLAELDERDASGVERTGQRPAELSAPVWSIESATRAAAGRYLLARRLL